MSAMMGSRVQGGAGILFYHRIAPEITGLPAPGLNVTPSQFRLQMEGLLERGFHPVSLQELLDLHASGRPFPGRAVAVTFDDAFAGVHRWAVPVLERLGIPATIFLVTRYAGSVQPMHFDMWGMTHHAQAPTETWRSMTWEECREAESTGLITVGCHTHAHDNYTGQPEAFRTDLAAAREEFQKNLGGPRRLFAVPYGNPSLGQVDRGLLTIAREEGMACALTTTLGLVRPGASPFGWPRLEVVEQDTGATLAAKVEGWYNWMGAVKNAVHRVAPW